MAMRAEAAFRPAASCALCPALIFRQSSCSSSTKFASLISSHEAPASRAACAAVTSNENGRASPSKQSAHKSLPQFAQSPASQPLQLVLAGPEQVWQSSGAATAEPSTEIPDATVRTVGTAASDGIVLHAAPGEAKYARAVAQTCASRMASAPGAPRCGRGFRFTFLSCNREGISAVDATAANRNRFCACVAT